MNATAPTLNTTNYKDISVPCQAMTRETSHPSKAGLELSP